MKKYLTIGEISKIKGASVKSLRYYGEIGILPPAYINETTGYRYYTINQMVIVDLILFCVDLEIPLKNFKNYILPDNLIDVAQIRKDGEEIASRKLKQITKNLYQIKKMSEHLNETTEILKHTGEFTRHIEKRYFLIETYENDINDISYFWGKISNIYKRCKDLDFAITSNQGVCVLYNKDVSNRFAYIEVDKPPYNIQEIIEIPSGDFICEVFIDAELTNANEKYFENVNYPNGTILILRELFDKTIESKPLPVEIQLLIK